ncbi:MAG: LOG family protein [Candidatus Obscuribacter phosphatis]|uniref:LOG family protein n=1 Tax=Candidatus Obscuribacter phosphatis TaxID=1906157 RepID=A0A8J7TMK1_9BACT|nr:LOG family protein [Candidatus Obscuribacter phosphatis]
MQEIETIEELYQVLAQGRGLNGYAVQGLDLSQAERILMESEVRGSYFLGCRISSRLEQSLEARGASVFPFIEGLIFNPFRPFLYSAAELYDRFNLEDPQSYDDCLDAKILAHFREVGGACTRGLINSLAQRLHDHSIGNAMDEFLENIVGPGKPRRGIVAIMGGHEMRRGAADYFSVALMSWRLTQLGYLMVSGGGPGAMEATHVGAWFADRSLDELESAVSYLSQAPDYKHELWLSLAFKVMQDYPAPESNLYYSLGVPTWLYGHEPPTPFASHIAKYFANSLREDGLVTIATSGIIYAPGSAGTIQEIFQDLTQNHYLTTGMASPMVFFGREYWTKTKPVYPFVKQLSANKLYDKVLTISDDVDEIVQYIQEHPPIVAPVAQ